jgi:hypothetical protein
MHIVFLPVAYNYLISQTNPPIRLPPDSQPNGHHDPKRAPELEGWKVLLLWLPALFDMISVFVRHHSPPTTNMKNVNVCFIPSFPTVAHRSSLDIHSGIDIPNDTKFFGAIRRPPQCCVLGKEAVALPVESSPFHAISSDQTCMLTCCIFLLCIVQVDIPISSHARCRPAWNHRCSRRHRIRRFGHLPYRQ